MSARVLKARQEGNEFRVSIHLDTTKALADGTPDPAWVHESSWATGDPEGAVREALLLAADELARRAPSEAAASPHEGASIDLRKGAAGEVPAIGVAAPPAESTGDAAAQKEG